MAGAIKGRGALSNPEPRYRRVRHDAGAPFVDSSPDDEDLPPRHPATVVRIDPARSIISHNESPDLPFRQSINPYRGCEHGCVYCYARPSHAWLDHSPGLDFETLLYAKPNAALLLDAELRKPGYRPEVIHLGANTDPYQPIERQHGITRAILAKLLEFRHPVTVITKGALIERDLDLLAALAQAGLTRVYVSITTLDPELKRTLEPRAASPAARLRVLAALARAGVPCGVMVAPVIPGVTDSELEAILHAAYAAGARRASWILLRLPLEVRTLFREWLSAHRPLAAARVMSLMAAMRGGRDYDAAFGRRMRGTGAYALLLRARFDAAARRIGFNAGEPSALDTAQFRVPPAGGQMTLW
jgi:DNA repair photolyase